MSGTLYGLGVGPGDPELITLKARDVLAHVPVIAYPAPEGGASLVRAIAAPHVPSGRTEIVVATPMTADRFPAQDVYDRYAMVIADHLRGGRDVAFLCEGDPFFYGSFMHVFDRLAGSYPTRVIPGVSSLTAVAAAARVPLAERDEVLMVLPATLPAVTLEARLALADAAAIMKVGRHGAKIREVLDRLGLLPHAHYVERATMASERVVPLEAFDCESAPYFSMVLVRRPPRARTPAITPPEGVALVALSLAGLGLARRLKPHLRQSIIHGLAGRAAEGADVPFADTGDHLRRLFANGTPLVGICAAGILIRAVAPLLSHKRDEPPVVAVAEDGRVAVPLLGGHRGANRLAAAIAATLGGVSAVTTAGDVMLGLALDDPPSGWRVATPEAAKPVAAALLARTPVAVSVEAGDAGWLGTLGNQAMPPSGDCVGEDTAPTIRVTDHLPRAGASATLVLHPPVLAVGVGCERDAPPEEVIGLVRRTLAAHGLAEGAVACVVSIDLKADEPAVHAVAEVLGVPARFFAVDALARETPRLATPSDVVFQAVGCHGVAEAAALAAVGAAGRLIVAKTVGSRATCAIARAGANLDAARIGRARGTLTVVGIGPGDARWRTLEATQALTRATDVVGLSLYLDLVADLIGHARHHALPMTEETGRARLALDLAAEGHDVALVSSGDSGIYGLAPLVFELLAREDRPEWNRIALAVAPGLSAVQAAAARAGAFCGHDFCTISLSDLLTPWAQIERRLKAAADGDFVVALYNPVSQRRRFQLPAARDILLGGRPTSTPVALARNLGRPGETVRFVTLGELEADLADMLTLVMVGSSASHVIRRGHRTWAYTPRGYAHKQHASVTEKTP